MVKLKKLFLTALFSLVFLPSFALAAITHNAAAGCTGTTSCTIGVVLTNDLIVCFAFRDGSNTAPTVPGGQNWTTTTSGGTGANTCSSVLVYRLASSALDTATGTFTNATSIVCDAWSGVNTTTPVGGESDGGGTTTTLSFGTFAFTVGDGTSWAVGFAGSRQSDGTITNAPSGMTNRQSVSDATDEAAIHDTNGGVASWSTTTVSIGGTNAGNRVRVLEIQATSTTSGPLDPMGASGFFGL